MSDLKIEIKKADFLNEQQKQVKQKIMEELMSAMNNNISSNIKLFENNQELSDVILSCLIMFCRDVLVHFFIFSGSSNIRGKIMNQVFDAIKSGVQERIKERMN